MWRDEHYLVAETGKREIIIQVQSKKLRLMVRICWRLALILLPYDSGELTAMSSGKLASRAERKRTWLFQRSWRDGEAMANLADVHASMQSLLSWNLVYELKFERVLFQVASDWVYPR